MGIRQTLNENPVVTASATGAIILIALIFIIWQAFGGHSRSNMRGSGKSFYSDDDGKTWFTDDATRIPPFDHNGKPAYRAIVYRCTSGMEFVGHLERYSEDVKAQMEEQIQKNPKAAAVLQYSAAMSAMEVKKPGQADWVKLVGSADAYRNIVQPTCPEDNTTNVTPVRPK